MSKLAENIINYRKKHNLTQSEFASKFYVTKQAISKWETGRGNPDSSLIPELAKVMGISIDELMGVKRTNKKVVTIITLLALTTILSVILVPSIVGRIEDAQEFRDFKLSTETSANIDLPDRGFLVDANLDKWDYYGNFMWANEMSYMVFDEYYQTQNFELEIITSDKWVSSLDSNLVSAIPVYLQDYTINGDYYCLYNMTTNTYNEFPDQPGEQNFKFLIYQLDNNRLIVFDFTTTIEYK